MPDDGPTEFTLARKAEQIGIGVICDVQTHKVEIAGGPKNRHRAEFATSSALALVYDQGLIIARHYRAGSEYARLHRLLWGRSSPKQSGLSKVLATALPERIEQANAAAREEMDDEAYADWILEQRALYERGEYRLRRMRGSITARRLVRITLRAVIIDDLLPTEPAHIHRLRLGLHELADVWNIE